MGLEYKDIINKHYGLGLSGREIVKQLGISKSGVNDLLTAFDRCTTLGFPLPDGNQLWHRCSGLQPDTDPSGAGRQL